MHSICFTDTTEVASIQYAGAWSVSLLHLICRIFLKMDAFFGKKNKIFYIPRAHVFACALFHLLFPSTFSSSLIFCIIDNKFSCQNCHCSETKEDEPPYSICSCCWHNEFHTVSNFKGCFIEVPLLV